MRNICKQYVFQDYKAFKVMKYKSSRRLVKLIHSVSDTQVSWFSSWGSWRHSGPVINNPVYPSALTRLTPTDNIPRTLRSNHTSLNPSLMGNPYRDSNSFALQTRVHVFSGSQGDLVMLCYQNYWSFVSVINVIHHQKTRMVATTMSSRHIKRNSNVCIFTELLGILILD